MGGGRGKGKNKGKSKGGRGKGKGKATTPFSLPTLTAFSDGSTALARNVAGWAAVVVDADGFEWANGQGSISRFETRWVTSTMAELAGLYEGLWLLAMFVCDGERREVCAFSDNLLAVETIVSFNPDGLRSMGAEHLVPLASACQNLLLSSFPSPQRVSIRVPQALSARWHAR